MGIPGLTSKVSQFETTWHHDEIAGADIYIDALNFAHRISSNFDKFEHERIRLINQKRPWYKKLSLYIALQKLVEKELLFLQNLNPNSITVVFDATISEEKFQIRMERNNNRIKSRKASTNSTTILAQIACEDPGINVIYSGAEAEDEIMKIIDEDESGDDRKKVVISSDSDMFRFNISKKSRVFIIPISYTRRKKSKFPIIPLKEAVSVVPKKLVVNPPIPRQGVSFVDAKKSMRSIAEFVNCGHIYKRLFTNLGIVWYHPNHEPPCDFNEVAYKIYRLAFGLICETFFKDTEVNTEEVEIWYQRSATFEKDTLKLYKENRLHWEFNKIKGLPIHRVAPRIMEPVLTKHRLPLKISNCISQMLKDVGSGRLVEEASKDEATDDLALDTAMGFFRAFSSAINLLNQVTDAYPQANRIKYDCSAQRLLTYMNNYETKKLRNLSI